MIGPILRWFREERRWHREHEAAWRGWTLPDQAPLSRFQEECEASVRAALGKVSSGLVSRNTEALEDGEQSIHAFLRDTKIEFSLYIDTAFFTGPGVDFRFEEWDALTPSDLIDAVAKKAVELVSESDGP